MKNQGIIARLTGPKAEKGLERIFQIAPSQHRETNPSSRVTQSHGHKVLVRSGSPAALEILCLRSKFSRKFWRPHDGDRECGDATLPRQLVDTQLRENEPVATFAKTAKNAKMTTFFPPTGGGCKSLIPHLQIGTSSGTKEFF